MNEICLSCRKHTKCGRAIHETIGCEYYVPQTNEEYIRTCSTEELAEVLLEIYKDGINDYKTDWREDCKEDWMDWLKEVRYD